MCPLSVGRGRRNYTRFGPLRLWKLSAANSSRAPKIIVARAPCCEIRATAPEQDLHDEVFASPPDAGALGRGTATPATRDKGAPITLVSQTLGKTTSVYAHAKPNDSSSQYLKRT